MALCTTYLWAASVSTRMQLYCDGALQIRRTSVDEFFTGAGRGAATAAGRDKIKQLLLHALVWRANMRAVARQVTNCSAPSRVCSPVLESMFRPSLHRGGEASVDDIVSDGVNRTGSAATQTAVTPLARLKRAHVHIGGRRITRSELCKWLCSAAHLPFNAAAPMAMLHRAARNPRVHLCADAQYEGGLLPIAVAKEVMSSQGVMRNPGDTAMRMASDELAGNLGTHEDPALTVGASQLDEDTDTSDMLKRNSIDACIWRGLIPGSLPRLYWIHKVPGRQTETTQRYKSLPHRTCADKLPGITELEIQTQKSLLDAAARQYVAQLAPPTSWQQVRAAAPASLSMVQAPPPQPSPVHQSRRSEPGPAAPLQREGSGAVTEPESLATGAGRKRRRDADSDYVASDEDDEVAGPAGGASAADAPERKFRRVKLSPLSPRRQLHLDDVMPERRGQEAVRRYMGKRGRRGGRSGSAGTGRGGKSTGTALAMKDDLTVQAVVGKSLDAVPLFDGSQQAMIPRAVKERLKPWQVAGLRHLFTTIILDHDSELWRKHRQETAAARLSQDAAGDIDDVPLHAGGAILAQTMGSGKTLQSIILALLFMAVRAKQRLHSRVVILVPTNVQYNWMDELQQWLAFFTTAGIIRHGSHLALETPDLRLKAWALEGASKLDPIQWWYEHGAAPPAKGTKQQRREELMRRKVGAAPCGVDCSRPHGSILVTTHCSFRDLWRNGQPPASGDAVGAGPTPEQQALQRVTEGAGLVIMDEAHCIRNEKINLSKAVTSFKTLRRVALSGYPLMNSVDEYYHMISWACPNFLGNKRSFDQDYKDPIEKGRQVGATKKERKCMLRQSQILRDLVGPILHRVSPAELGSSLPPKVEAVIAVRMPDTMSALYKVAVDQMHAARVTFLAMANLVNELLFNPQQFMDTMMSMAAGHAPLAADLERDPDALDGSDAEAPPAAPAAAPRAATGPASARNKAGTEAKPHLSQEQAQIIVEKFKNILDGHELKLEDSPKARLVLHLVREAVAQGRKVLVFVSFLQDVRTLQHHWHREAATAAGSKQVMIRVMSGRTKSTERRQRVAQFNEHNGPGVFILTTRACGVGINLTSATRAIMPFPNFNPSHESQAAGRIHRLGQKNSVEIFRVVCDGAFDHKVMKIAMEKEAMAMAVVDGQGVKAIMERDKANFQLDPTPDGNPLDAMEDCQQRIALQGVVDNAAAAGCSVAKVQLWSQLLAEDKDMKINAVSRHKLLRKVLADKTDSAAGGNRFTAWQIANLRRSERCRPPSRAADAAAEAQAVAAEDSGVELSSDDDFDMAVPQYRHTAPARPPGPSDACAAAIAGLVRAPFNGSSSAPAPGDRATATQRAFIHLPKLPPAATQRPAGSARPAAVQPDAAMRNPLGSRPAAVTPHATAAAASEEAQPRPHGPVLGRAAMAVAPPGLNAGPAVEEAHVAVFAAPSVPAVPHGPMRGQPAPANPTGASTKPIVSGLQAPTAAGPPARPEPGQPVPAPLASAEPARSDVVPRPATNTQRRVTTAPCPPAMPARSAAHGDLLERSRASRVGEQVESAGAAAAAAPFHDINGRSGQKRQWEQTASEIAVAAHRDAAAQTGVAPAPADNMGSSRPKMPREEWERHCGHHPVVSTAPGVVEPAQSGDVRAVTHPAQQAAQPAAAGAPTAAAVQQRVPAQPQAQAPQLLPKAAPVGGADAHQRERGKARQHAPPHLPMRTPTLGSGRGRLHATPGSAAKGMHTLPELGYGVRSSPGRAQAAGGVKASPNASGAAAAAPHVSPAQGADQAAPGSLAESAQVASHGGGSQTGKQAPPQTLARPAGHMPDKTVVPRHPWLRPRDVDGSVRCPGSGYTEEGDVIIIDDDDE
eukprot:jgi/Ulvmu1/4085/UM019_0064.1